MNNIINRKIVWLSSLAEKNKSQINFLEKKLSEFYLKNPDYYSNIDFTSENWVKDNEAGYIDILETIKTKEKILEVGCGSANILKYYPGLEKKYSGCDFSTNLIASNSEKYSKAEFKCIDTPNLLPYEDLFFDVVFSVFVIEHSANPSLLLRECLRVLKKNGVLIILCPDFLGRGRMSSQRSGFSRGTSRDKLKQKKYLDALLTFYDNKIRIPVYCKYLSLMLLISPKFYININPTIFFDVFIPDVDAVYLTSRTEMISYLKKDIQVVQNSSKILRYENNRKLIYLKFIKFST